MPNFMNSFLCTAASISLCTILISPFGTFIKAATNFGEKIVDFSTTFKYVFKNYFSDVVLRRGHVKSNCINFVFLTVITKQQVM